jgi:hypothetical protein
MVLPSAATSKCALAALHARLRRRSNQAAPTMAMGAQAAGVSVAESEHEHPESDPLVAPEPFEASGLPLVEPVEPLELPAGPLDDPPLPLEDPLTPLDDPLAPPPTSNRGQATGRGSLARSVASHRGAQGVDPPDRTGRSIHLP